jgi:hypothetical protein
MSKPFSQLDILRASAESQKVPLHVQRGVFLLEKVLGGIFIIGSNVGGQVRCDRWRGVEALCARHNVLRLCRLLALTAIVHFGRIIGVFVVAPPAEALTPVNTRISSDAPTQVNSKGSSK